MQTKPPITQAVQSDQKGFTLIEMLVSLVVLAILLSIGVPSFQSLVAQNRATSAANELQSALHLARSTALAQSRPVTVCAANFAVSPPACRTDEDWSEGWMVLQDGQTQPLRERGALSPSVTLTGAPRRVYSSTGTLLGQTNIDFSLSVDSATDATRRICLFMSGRSEIVSGDAPCR